MSLSRGPVWGPTAGTHGTTDADRGACRGNREWLRFAMHAFIPLDPSPSAQAEA